MEPELLKRLIARLLEKQVEADRNFERATNQRDEDYWWGHVVAVLKCRRVLIDEVIALDDSKDAQRLGNECSENRQ